MNQNRPADRRDALTQPLTLRSGITPPNRIAKAATTYRAPFSTDSVTR
jgi:hypothetical protein